MNHDDLIAAIRSLVAKSQPVPLALVAALAESLDCELFEVAALVAA